LISLTKVNLLLRQSAAYIKFMNSLRSR